MSHSHSASASSAAFPDGIWKPAPSARTSLEQAVPGRRPEAPELAARPQAPAPPVPLAKQPDWTPRMWQGFDLRSWLMLLVRNRFAVHPSQWYMAVIITLVSVINTLLRLLQDALFSRAVRDTRIEQPPIFLLGHWRSGTTLLHEMMSCDQRFGYPSTYACMEPNHFLLTERLFTRWLSFLVPASRPMDNMKVGLDRPQEDELAMCMLGAGSPYSTIAFPNRRPDGPDFLDLEALPPADLSRWKRAFDGFLRQLTFKTGKRLVLKSPTHTARIKTLKDMFPGAIFVHIVRDPYVVFSSTVNLWRTLHGAHGLQVPTHDGLEETVLQTFVRIYEKLEAGKKLLGPDQFYELRYEDLVKDPAGEMRKLYAHFGLAGFEAYLPQLQEYLANVKGYETNKYRLTEAQRSLVTRRWGDVIRRYGYAIRRGAETPAHKDRPVRPAVRAGAANVTRHGASQTAAA
jgi:omega-hydroxy-beta-dihydromenaquinone-9 sulfotransferase